MTVRELIKLLQTFDPDDIVMVPVSSQGLGVIRRVVSNVIRKVRGAVEIS